MKKFLALILMLSILLCGCGAATTDPTDNPATAPDSEVSATNAPASSAEDYSFTYNGTVITLHAPAEPIVAALGEPMSYTESASCAFKGLDKTYYYGAFYLDTYPVDGKDFVYGFWFVDDTVATPEGIFIGSAKTDVDSAYGAEYFDGANTYTIPKGTGVLTIIIENERVSSIQYMIDVE